MLTADQTIDEIATELYDQGRDADAHALTLIRCLDYDARLVLDHEAYRATVCTILNAMDHVRQRRLTEVRAELSGGTP